MILFNTHTHTEYSPDGRSTIEEHIQKARSLGVSYVAFTDHFDFLQMGLDVCDTDHIAVQMEHYRKMVADMAEHKVRCKKEGIFLECGIEIGWDGAVYEKYASQLLRDDKIDYVINSIHDVDGQSCYHPEFFDGRTQHKGYALYLEWVYKSLFAEYRFDTVGHIGYCCRNAPFAKNPLDYQAHKSILDKILTKIARDGKVIELNTSVNSAQTDTLASLEILQVFKKMGGENITFAADAHHCKDLVRGFEMAKIVAKRAGFDWYSIKKDGVWEKVSID
ncbi:MAG: histidinol-phosphatase HisJ family protein [Firmicutes bacterium]|nr:histidinol-phosphatase HisJ family protein [Bacillota bacterium]